MTTPLAAIDKLITNSDLFDQVVHGAGDDPPVDLGDGSPPVPTLRAAVNMAVDAELGDLVHKDDAEVITGAKQFTAPISAPAGITDIPNPVNPGDAVNNGVFLAGVAAGRVPPLADVQAAAIVNVNIASPGTTFDGVVLSHAGVDSFLAPVQAAPAEVGVYAWNGAAVPATRRADADTAIEIGLATVYVEPPAAGTNTNGGKTFQCKQTAAQITAGGGLGTCALNFIVAGNQGPVAAALAAETATRAATDTAIQAQVTQLNAFTGNSQLLHKPAAGQRYFPVQMAANGALIAWDDTLQTLVGPGIGGEPAVPTPLDPADYPAITDINYIQGSGESLDLGYGPNSAVLSAPSLYGHLGFGSGPRSSSPLPGSVGANSSPGTDPAHVTTLFENTLAADGSTIEGQSWAVPIADGFSQIHTRHNGVPLGQIKFFVALAGHEAFTIENISPGGAGNWYSLLEDQMRAAKAYAVPQGKSISCSFVPFAQGATDLTNDIATSMALIETLRASIEASAKAIFGQTNPVHMLHTQLSSHIIGQSFSMQQAVYQLCKTSRYHHFVGTTRQYPYGSDDIHVDNVGNIWRGNVNALAEKLMMIDNIEPPWLEPMSHWVRGQTVFAKFDVPEPPLVFKGSTYQHGFDVRDDTGIVGLKNFRIIGSTLMADMSRPTTTNAVWSAGRYYLDASLPIEFGASCDLQDATDEFFTRGGVEFYMERVCPHYYVPLPTLVDQ